MLQEGDICIVMWASEIIRNGDVFYPFRQNSDILLLTEISSPEMIFLAFKRNNITEFYLFSDPLSDHEKLWGTARLSYEEMSEISSLTSIAPIDACDEFLTEICADIRMVYATHETFNCFFEGRVSPESWSSLAVFLEPLRMKKCETEIDAIRRSIDITHEAFEIIKKNLWNLEFEYQVEASIAQVFRSHHATEAYPTIVASGINATVLHYTHHSMKLNPKDLLLVDFGAEYQWYAADITRIFAQDLSMRQEEVITSVIAVKSYAESLLMPGTKKTEYEKMVRIRMNEELEKLGLLKRGAPDEMVLSKKYYPHSTSHFLGLDVHDVGSRDAILESGMVLTCEPGIYIPEEWIGVRLEDDILITVEGNENLSRQIPLFEK